MKWLGQHIFDLKSKFRNDVTIDGDLTVSGTYTQIDTDVTTTEQWLVTNDGTGPAAIINQKGSQDIFDVQDDGTSVFYIEDGGNVGIGTTSPSELLHISSGVATHAKILIDAGADADLILDKGAGSRRSHIDYKIAGTTKWYAGTADSDVVGDGDDYFIGTTVGGTNAEFFLKRSNGNIGIGTTSPSEKLHVRGGNIRIDSNSSGGQNLQFRNNGTANALLSNSYNINAGSSTDFNTYVYGNNPYSIWTNNTNRLSVTGAGNVGIGTTSPSHKLTVNASNNTTAVGIDFPSAHFDFSANSTSGYTSNFRINDVGMDIGHDSTARALNLQTGSADRLTISGSGNVGIGTTSPSDLLMVAGNARVTGTLKIADGAYNAPSIAHRADEDTGIYFPANDTIGISTAALERMRITSDGNVGIGTTSPASLLHVAGTVQVGVDGTGHDVTFYGDTAGRYMYWDESGDELYFTDNAKLRLGTGGDVKMWHNGADSYIMNLVGDLNILNSANDKDIILSSDDGSGGHTAYLTLDGSAGYTTVQKDIRADDGVYIAAGAGLDLSMRHNGTNSYLNNITGDLYISNYTDDGDIIFQSDDGSGGLAEYFRLDGSSATHDGSATTALITRFPDNSKIYLGTGDDGRLYHNGTDTYLQNTTGDLIIQNFADDKDIVFKSDDGSGGTATYFFLDGSSTNMKAYKDMRFIDNVDAEFGDGGDFKIYHDGSNTYLEQINSGTGNIVISNANDDADIIFKSDDGSGGLATYITIDGGNTDVDFHKNLHLLDNVYLKVGSNTGGDLQIYHNGSHSLISNQVGNLYLRNQTDDGDIIIQADDGLGGDATYMTFDGGISSILAYRDILMANDGNNGKIKFGASQDLSIYHDGSQSYIDSTGTGNLYIRTKNNSSIYLQDTNGQALAQFSDGGGSHLYYNNSLKISTTNTGVDITGELQADSLDIDGVADISGAVTLGTPLATDQQKHLAWFEIAGFGTGDGTNYEISVNLDNDTAPFSHNVSTGANGTTAITVQNIMRSGGTVMTRAGTIKRWTGWATTAGSSTANVALFKITPARNDNSDVAPVLIDNVSYTAVGNAKMLDFNETEFADVSVAAKDIIVTGIKCEDTKTTYFSSTLEIEF